jgi:hypothetical protein
MFWFGGGFAAGLSIAANAFHWFITPMAHPDASQGRMAAVGVQALAGLLLSAWTWIQAKRESAAQDPGAHLS